ncbi:MAG: class II aldolase/adducin family protein [Planctomycetes bacterium]|nr:class II aldolase/adducin family protein [Planctomycetota bacterium]
MKNRWTQQDARDAVDRWGNAHGEAFALRLYSARLLGEDPDLVLHGGGNVSLKGTHRTVFGDEVDALFVKASGRDLATLDPRDLPALDLACLQRLCNLDALGDDDMVNELRTHLFDASAPTPSIEALVHAIIPHAYVDHSHADAVLAVTNHVGGDELAREAMGDRVAVLPYVRPGFELAKAVADCVKTNSEIDGIVLLHHGLITFGQDAETAYERHIELVDACERLIAKHFTASRQSTVPRGVRREGEVDKRAEQVAPLLRGLLAMPTGDEDHPYRRSIMEWRTSEELLALISTQDAPRLAAAGALTGDHIIRTKAKPLYVADPNWSDGDKLREQLRTHIDEYRKEYTAYVEAHGGCATGLDPSPRVVVLPGAGLFCWGISKREALVTADIAEHTLITKAKSDAIGPSRQFVGECLKRKLCVSDQGERCRINFVYVQFADVDVDDRLGGGPRYSVTESAG